MGVNNVLTVVIANVDKIFRVLFKLIRRANKKDGGVKASPFLLSRTTMSYIDNKDINNEFLKLKCRTNDNKWSYEILCWLISRREFNKAILYIHNNCFNGWNYNTSVRVIQHIKRLQKYQNKLIV